jgi:O-acetyl-ADP-ribose deacetylase (regulator of RNase III)
MDVSVVQGNPYALPTSRRVGVIVHDGTTDLRLWPGPGADRELANAYGDLSRVLDQERQRQGGPVSEGTLIRLHPGRLHCDFLLWFASRGPETKGFQAPAPKREAIEKIVWDALTYAGERNAIQVAFGNLGAGPEQIEDGERLSIVARAAALFHEDRVQRGLPSRIEEVLVCDPRLSAVTAARKRLGALVRPPAPEKPLPGAQVAKPALRPASAGGKSTAKPAPRGKPRLDDGEVARARAVARPWDRTVKYGAGDWFIHAKFGVGRVDEVTVDGFIVCLFEDGEQRKLIHARA